MSSCQLTNKQENSKEKYTGKETKPFSINNFIYEPVLDFYICPEKQILKYTNDIIIKDIPQKMLYRRTMQINALHDKNVAITNTDKYKKTNNQDLKEQEKKMETKEAQKIYELRNRIENTFAYMQSILKHTQYQTKGLKKRKQRTNTKHSRTKLKTNL